MRCVAVEEPLADLGLQHDVREGLRRAVVHLPGQPAALLLLGLDDGLQELRLVDDRRQGFGAGRDGERDVTGDGRGLADERVHALDELSLRLQRSELSLHRDALLHGVGELLERAEDLLTLVVRGILLHLDDLRRALLLARLEAAHLGLGRLDEEIELARLPLQLLYLLRKLLRDFGHALGDRHHAPSGPLIHPCLIA